VGKMGPVPAGCCPKWPHTALLVTHLDQPNHTPRALPGTIWAGNAATWQVLTGPNMSEYLLILVSTVLANNFVLVRFLGLCPLMGVSNKLEGAIGMSVATMFVLTISSVSSYLLNRYLLQPLELEYLSTLSFILVIAVVVQLTELIIRKTSPLLYRILGIFLPLITTNCAVLGVALLNLQEQHNLLQSALYGFGAATGFGLVLVMFAAMRERIAFADVPVHFRGAPIGLITAGLMALAFMGFTGLAKL